MKNNTVEEILVEFDPKFYYDHEERGLTYLRNDVVGWLRTELTRLTQHHQDQLREVYREILQTAYFDDWDCHVIDYDKVVALAQTRGIDISDKN